MQIEIKRASKFGMYGICAFDKLGRQYVLKQQFGCDSMKLGRTLEKVRAKMVIDLRFWRGETGSAKRYMREIGF